MPRLRAVSTARDHGPWTRAVRTELTERLTLGVQHVKVSVSQNTLSQNRPFRSQARRSKLRLD